MSRIGVVLCKAATVSVRTYLSFLCLIVLHIQPLNVRMNAQTCGIPPVNISASSGFKSAWMTYACSATNTGLKATIPIDDLPVGFDFSNSERQCQQSSMSMAQAQSFVQQYIANNPSLLIAECGYRRCQLQSAGSNPDTLRLFADVCSSVGGETSRIKLQTPLSTIGVERRDANQQKPLELVLKGSADADTHFTLIDTKPFLTAVKVPPVLYADKEESLLYNAKVPPGVLRGQPTYLPYWFQVGTGSGTKLLGGVVQFVRSTDPSCKSWMNDFCVVCEQELAISDATEGAVFRVSCGDLPPNKEVRVNVEGSFVTKWLEDRRPYAPDWGYWLQRSSLRLNVGTTVSFGAQQTVNSLARLSFEGKTIVPSSGKVTAAVTVAECANGKGGSKDTCSTWGAEGNRGPLKIKFLVDDIDALNELHKAQMAVTARSARIKAPQQ